MLKTKTKRLFFASILCFLFLSFTLALAAEGAACPEYKGTGGIVYCASAACTFDDLFCTINRVISFVMFYIVPPIAVITVVIAAINLMTSSGDPGKLESAKKTIIWIIFGLVVIYGAWALVRGFISALGGAGGDTLHFFNGK
jgi:hypothetical protein